MARAITKGDMPLKLKNLITSLVITFRRVLFITRVRFIALRGRAFRAFIYFSICISKSDGNVSHFFLPKSDSLDT